MARLKVKEGCDFVAVPRGLAEILPQLRARGADVLLLAFLQARRDGGGLWIYGSAREIGAGIGFGSTSAKHALSQLVDIGVFVDHMPPTNAAGVGTIRFSPDYWPYEVTP